jgi:hypothetical protein
MREFCEYLIHAGFNILYDPKWHGHCIKYILLVKLVQSSLSRDTQDALICPLEFYR